MNEIMIGDQVLPITKPEWAEWFMNEHVRPRVPVTVVKIEGELARIQCISDIFWTEKAWLRPVQNACPMERNT